MSRTALRHLRLVGPLTVVAAALSISSLPAFAQSAPSMADCSAIHFNLSNPGPGSRVEEGTDVVQGVAMDSRATTGAQPASCFLLKGLTFVNKTLPFFVVLSVNLCRFTLKVGFLRKPKPYDSSKSLLFFSRPTQHRPEKVA